MAYLLTPRVWDSLANKSYDTFPANPTLLCIQVQGKNWLCMLDTLNPEQNNFGRIAVKDEETMKSLGNPRGWIIRLTEFQIVWEGKYVIASKLEKLDDSLTPSCASLSATVHPGLRRNPANKPNEAKKPEQNNQNNENYQNNNNNNDKQSDGYGPVRHTSSINLRSGPYSGSVARQDPTPYMQISDLTPYTAKWTIKARVVVKSDLRTYNNAKGEGKFFSIDLMDKSTKQIRATLFNRACDKFHTLLEEGNTYTFGKGTLTPANKRFNTLPHACEIKFDENSLISLVQNDSDIPEQKHDFTRIAEIEKKEKGDIIDVLGIVSDSGAVQMISLKAGGEKAKRDLTIVDSSRTTISFTIWGDKAQNLDTNSLEAYPIICIKGAKIGEYMGKKLEMGNSTRTVFNMRTKEAQGLLNWWKTEGSSSNLVPLVDGRVDDKSPYKTIEQVVEEAANADSASLSGSGMYFNVRGTVHNAKRERFYWVACPDCRKKVVENEEGSFDDNPGWFCSNCNKSVPTPSYMYILDIQICDHTQSLRASAMADNGQNMLPEFPCKDLSKLQIDLSLTDDEGRGFDDIFDLLEYSEWNFRIGAKAETYMDETRIKYKIFKPVPIEKKCEDEAKQIIKLLRSKGCFDT